MVLMTTESDLAEDLRHAIGWIIHHYPNSHNDPEYLLRMGHFGRRGLVQYILDQVNWSSAGMVLLAPFLSFKGECITYGKACFRVSSSAPDIYVIDEYIHLSHEDEWAASKVGVIF